MRLPYQTTFRHLVKVPNIVLGGPSYICRVDNESGEISFEDIRTGRRKGYSLDAPLDIYEYESDHDSSISSIAVQGLDLEGIRDMVTVHVRRVPSEEEMNPNFVKPAAQSNNPSNT